MRRAARGAPHRDPAERAAWQALRNGEPAQAMAHYRERGALQFADTRVEAVDQAAQATSS